MTGYRLRFLYMVRFCASLCALGYVVAFAVESKAEVADFASAAAASNTSLAPTASTAATTTTAVAANDDEASLSQSNADLWVPFWSDVVDTLEIVGRRHRLEDRLASRPGFSTALILGPEVAASRDLSDLLDRVAGVHIHSYGGVGSFSTASIRGSSSSHVQVLLDGVPLASARDGVSHLGLVPMALLDYAIVHKGAQTLHFAGPPGQGVVELRTPPAASTAPVVALSTGSYGMWSGRGHYGTTWKKLGLFLSGQRRSIDGDYHYLNRNGTPLNSEDDHEVARQNNDHDDHSLLWKASLRATPDLTLDYTGQAATRDEGVPGTETIQTDSSRYTRDWNRHQLAMDWSPLLESRQKLWGRARVHVAGYREQTDDRFANPHGEVGLGRVDEESALTHDGGELAVDLPVHPLGMTFHGLHSRSEQTWRPFDRLHDLAEYRRRRQNRTSLLSTTWNGFAKRVGLEVSYRWDRATDNYSGPVIFGRPPEASAHRASRFEAPTFGARIQLARGLSIQGNRGKYLRRPTFPELFGANGVQDGNTKLVDETGMQWDAGLRLHRTHWQGSVAYFESVTNDQIVLLQNSQRTVKAHNVARTWTRGVESSQFLSASLPRDVRLEGEFQFTWQEAKDIGRSRTYRYKDVPYLPAREQYARVSVGKGSMRAEYGLHSRSEVFRDRYNTDAKQAAPQVLHDFGIEIDVLGGRATARFEIQNLDDRRAQDIEGYPLPGRTYQFEILLRPFTSVETIE